jgi:protein-S-isoprenylcysteine O-methyltransferase Ste14
LTRRQTIALDIAERVVIVAIVAFFARRILGAYFYTGSIAYLALFGSEMLQIALLVTRRTTDRVAVRPHEWAVAFAGACLPLMATSRMDHGPLVSTDALNVVITLGFVLQLAGKLTLARSFGIVAANRGVKVGGPYRFVRHPIYAGYVLVHLGFLLFTGSPWNLAIYGAAFALQLWRIVIEERVLGADERYASYAARVRWRLMPGLF